MLGFLHAWLYRLAWVTLASALILFILAGCRDDEESVPATTVSAPATPHTTPSSTVPPADTQARTATPPRTPARPTTGDKGETSRIKHREQATPTPTTVSTSQPAPTPETGRIIPIIATGSFEVCTLDHDGSPVCWVIPLLEETDEPFPTPEGETFTTLDSGGLFLCGLREDGSPHCWTNFGYLSEESAAAPDEKGLGAISTGGVHACGLKEDGTSVCWLLVKDDSLAESAPPPEGKGSPRSAAGLPTPAGYGRIAPFAAGRRSMEHRRTCPVQISPYQSPNG